MSKAGEIFASIRQHQIRGMMLHEQMADYFDFLNLRGFKRMHEYHFLDECVQMRGVSRYYLNHFNMLIADEAPTDPAIIPDTWKNYTRQQVTAEVKKQAVRNGMLKWTEWERETKKKYERAYSELCALGEVAAAHKIKELVCDVDEELKYADRMHIRLEGIGYSIADIDMMQDELHEKYKQKTREMGVEIC